MKLIAFGLACYCAWLLAKQWRIGRLQRRIDRDDTALRALLRRLW